MGGEGNAAVYFHFQVLALDGLHDQGEAHADGQLPGVGSEGAAHDAVEEDGVGGGVELCVCVCVRER